MPNVVMLLSNSFRPDLRVAKEAVSLARAGYSITIICWDRRAELPAEEIWAEGIHILRVQTVRTVYGAGIRQVLYTPRFWSAAVEKALPLKPILVHCHDLDTLYGGVQIKQKLGCKLIFDAHEDYPTQMTLYLPGVSRFFLDAFERWLLHRVDAFIAASSVYMDKLTQIGYHDIVYLPNVHDLAPFENITESQLSQARQDLGLDQNDYVVSYIGGFSRNRLILPLVEAMRNLPDTTLLLAGDGHQRGAVEAAIQGIANVRYFGWLPSDKIPLYTRLSDVVYYCLKPDYPGSKYNAPNTLSNAMAAGRPVISNNLGDLGRIVQKTGCGLLLDEVSPQTIHAAVQQLHDPVLRNKLGKAGYLAAKSEFNWSMVEKRLVQLYGYLISNKLAN